MAEFTYLFLSKESILRELDELLRLAQSEAPKQTASAVRLQAAWRGKRVRSQISSKRSAAHLISRVYRGFVGRRLTQRIREQKEERLALSVFHYCAIRIQVTYRGYMSRKYKHDFYARKKYLSDLVQRNEATRERIQEQLHSQRQQAEGEERRRKEKAFKELSQNYHHLLSTKAQPGVYNSPYMLPDEKPTVFGAPVEEHLRNNVKDLLRSQTIAKKRHVPKPRERLSVQASSKYEAVQEAERTEKYLSRRNMLGPDFVAPGRIKDNVKLHIESVNTGIEYVDYWRNPYLIRGIPRSKDDLEPTKTTLGRFPEIPYYTAASGIKSAVYPRGLFET